jgi:hypothetical protein
MQSIKEKKLLVKFALQMGQPVDASLLEEVRRHEELQRQITESVRRNMVEDLKELFDVPLPVPAAIEKEQPEPLVEEVFAPLPAKEEKSLFEKSAEAIKKVEQVFAIKEDSYQQPSVPVPNDLKAVKDKIKFLEQWVAKISATGPGGGAGEVYNLDMPTTLVSTSSYTVGKKDYYIGVNYAGTVTITLPTSVKQGRYIIIKDESGRCSQYPITVLGNVDNDPNGFILKLDNGGIQMIYRNGWRIV